MIGPVLALAAAAALITTGWFAYQAGVPARELLTVDAPIAAATVVLLWTVPIFMLAATAVLVVCSLLLEHWRP